VSAQRAGEAAAAEQAAARFGEELRAAARFEADRAVVDSLCVEARPVIEALLDGIVAADRTDPRALALREALTLTRLLGRRAAELGATPTAALALAPCLVRAVEGSQPLAEDLRAIALEGYVAAREERLDERASRRMADAIAVVEAAPGCIAVLPAGLQDDDELERVFDGVGRRLLERDARACVVHLGELSGADRERARRVFALHSTCLMLGVTCIYTAVRDDWRDAARDAGIALDDVRFEPDFASGLRAALDACGLELRPRARLGDVLRRMVTPRRGG
jgi:hypothetical protein